MTTKKALKRKLIQVEAIHELEKRKLNDRIGRLGETVQLKDVIIANLLDLLSESIKSEK